MELRVLRYFLAVAREENITRAAALLHLTQPTLSRQLMQLEEELGVKLFRRSQYRIVLTEDGMLLRRRAQEIVELAEKTEQEFARRGAELSGEISIGAGETRGMNFLSAQVRSFRALHPQVRFRIHSANADDIKERLENGLLDMGLLVEPVEIGRYAFLRLPQRDRWGVLVPKDSPLAQLDGVTPQDLAPWPLLMSSRYQVVTELESWFGDQWNHLEVAGTFNLMLNAVNMVENGVGIAMGFDLGNLSDQLRFVPLAPAMESGVVLAWKKDQVFSPLVNEFHLHIQSAGAQTAGAQTAGAQPAGV